LAVIGVIATLLLPHNRALENVPADQRLPAE
jgi:hypothetical protein